MSDDLSDLSHRMRVYTINPRLFGWYIGRKLKFTGLPDDAEYVRSWHDPNTDLFMVVMRSRSFDPISYTIRPIPDDLYYTIYDEVDNDPK